MILKWVICILPVLMNQFGYSQEVDIKIKADRHYSHEAKNIRFNVLIKNKLFKEYFVQDTLITQRTVGTGACTLWSYVEKKNKQGKYLPGEFKYGSAPLLAPDSCLHACCTCLLLKEGDAVGFNINLLDSYNRIDKGEYRVYVLLHPPDPRKKVSKGYYAEFKSNYFYFIIN